MGAMRPHFFVGKLRKNVVLASETFVLPNCESFDLFKNYFLFLCIFTIFSSFFSFTSIIHGISLGVYRVQGMSKGMLGHQGDKGSSMSSWLGRNNTPCTEQKENKLLPHTSVTSLLCLLFLLLFSFLLVSHPFATYQLIVCHVQLCVVFL